MLLFVLLVWAPAAGAARTWQPASVLSLPDVDAWIGKPVPAVAFSATGDATAAWLERQGSAFTVAGRTLPKLGPPGARQVLGGSYNPPTVAAAGDGGASAATAWIGSATAGEPGPSVLVSETDANGVYGAPREVAQTGAFYNQPGAAIAANGRGEIVVVYVTDDGRLTRVRREAGGTWSAPQALTPPRGVIVWRIAAVMSETGEVAYTWYGWIPDEGNRAGVVTEQPDGTTAPPRALTAAGVGSGVPWVAMDAAGNAVLTWLELRESQHFGPVFAAVKAPGSPFGPGQQLDGSASSYAGAPVALSASGLAVVAVAHAIATSASTGSLSGIRAIVGHVPSGVFGASEPVITDIASDPVAVATDPIGNALFFFQDWDTNEPRVVRRAVSGQYGQARNAVGCPNPGVWPIAAHVDALGDAALVWSESNWLKVGAPLEVSRDQPSQGFAPDPCPARPPWLTWTENPQPGVPVAFDASGANDPDAASVRFEWDLDNDGTFELDTAGDPRASATFSSAGVHRIGLRVTQYSQRPGNSMTSTCSYEVRIGLPPLPPDTNPDPWGADPRPPGLPDESPWPTGPGPEPPAVVPPLPVDVPLPGPSGSSPTPPPSPTPRPPTTTRQPRELALALVVAARASRSELEGRGLPVTIRSGSTGLVRVRLRAPGTSPTAPGRVLVSKRVKVRAGVPRTLRLRPPAKRRAALRSAGGRALVIEVRETGGAITRASVRVRR